MRLRLVTGLGNHTGAMDWFPEAIETIVSHAFNHLNLETIWCGYKDGNLQSKIAQEKQGFKHRLTKTDMYNPYLNEVIIEHFTSLTKKDWESK